MLPPVRLFQYATESTLLEQVRQHCDLILDGTKPVEDLAREACTHIQLLFS